MYYITDLQAQCSLYKNTIYNFQYQRKMLFLKFINYCFKPFYFFFWVNSSNLMDTIKTIIVLIELQLNSTVNSYQTCLDHAEVQKHDIIST